MDYQAELDSTQMTDIDVVEGVAKKQTILERAQPFVTESFVDHMDIFAISIVNLNKLYSHRTRQIHTP